MDVVDQVEKEYMKKEVDPFAVGDTVRVHVKIREGEKDRVQVFVGTVIARKGSGTRATFTVRRIVAGEGVERIFPVHSPKVLKVEATRHGRVRRAKLYYLRDRVGKATKLRERRGATKAEKVFVPSDETPDETQAQSSSAAGGEAQTS